MVLLTYMFSCKKIRLKMVYEGLNIINKLQLRETHLKVDNSQAIENYESAVKILNSLQPNSVVIQDSILRKNDSEIRHILEIKKYLLKLNISLDDLDKFPVIHVSGTKGKGSTCALTDSILNKFGLKTGFYSSPHLVSVTERIRLNSKDISREKFAKYFWKVYNILNNAKENDEDLPQYFKFLTILSIYVFIQEQVDVAIYEVGIGGKYDATNVFRSTKTVGITSLGLEHTSLLGNTLEDIAWQKSGIIKSNSNVFTVEQPAECVGIMQKTASENNAKLCLVPKFEEYHWTRTFNLALKHECQKKNASLAIQLAYDFLKSNQHQLTEQTINKIKFLLDDSNQITLKTSEEVIVGLENCIWPGRCQLINFKNKHFYLDGAHTNESINICIDWFIESTKNNSNLKCLLFNATGDRDFVQILKVLNDRLKLDYIFFSPNIAVADGFSSDNSNYAVRNVDQFRNCCEFETMWKSLNTSNVEFALSQSGKTACFGKDLNINGRSLVAPCVTDVLKNVENINYNGDIDILVTGSLHLIGATLLSFEEFYKTKSIN